MRLGTKILKHLASGDPEVLGSMPICPLRSSNFTGKRNGPDLAWSMLQEGAQMAPEPVNDLRAGFHGHALSVGKLVFPCLCFA